MRTVHSLTVALAALLALFGSSAAAGNRQDSARGTEEVVSGQARAAVTVSQEGDVEPTIVESPELILVGIVNSAPDVHQMDIHGMWQRFLESSDEVKHQVPDVGYELHVQGETEPTLHLCLVGVAVSEIEDVPTEMFAKIVPAGTYAVFNVRMGDGGFGGAYERIFTWLAASEYAASHPFDVQRYDARFKGIDDPDSELDIYVPVKLKV